MKSRCTVHGPEKSRGLLDTKSRKMGTDALKLDPIRTQATAQAEPYALGIEGNAVFEICHSNIDMHVHRRAPFGLPRRRQHQLRLDDQRCDSPIAARDPGLPHHGVRP